LAVTSFQKKKARGIAKKVRTTEEKQIDPDSGKTRKPPTKSEPGEDPARGGLIIALRKSEFDRFRPIFMTSTLVGQTKGFVRG